MKTQKLIVPALLALAFGSAAALTSALPPSDTTIGGTQVQQDRGVSYLNGGVGEGERAAMNLRAGQYPLHIVLSGHNEQYVVAEELTVSNAQGEVVATVPDAGPLVMLDLPPGQYRLQASVDGMDRERVVEVGQDDPKVYWNIPAAGATGVAPLRGD